MKELTLHESKISNEHVINIVSAVIFIHGIYLTYHGDNIGYLVMLFASFILLSNIATIRVICFDENTIKFKSRLMSREIKIDELIEISPTLRNKYKFITKNSSISVIYSFTGMSALIENLKQLNKELRTYGI